MAEEAEVIEKYEVKGYGEVTIYRPQGGFMPVYHTPWTVSSTGTCAVPGVAGPRGAQAGMSGTGIYGRLQPLLEDDNLEEVMVLSPKKSVKIYHRKHGMCDTEIVLSEDETGRIIANILAGAGREPGGDLLVDTTLPSGDRVNITIKPASPEGSTLTIRKFTRDSLTIIDLVNKGSLSPRVAAYLWVFVEGLRYKPANIIISGGTGSGKTTTLNSLTSFVPYAERIVTIEDTAELQLAHENWVRLEAVRQSARAKEVDMADLLKNALRMRPDRLVVGEVRGEEAFILFTAMNTGHNGCMGTLHANTARETVTRLTNPPMSVPAIMLTGLDLIVMQQRLRVGNKTLRKITEISEVGNFENNMPTLNTIFKWSPETDTLKETGVTSILREKISKEAGISPQEFDRIVQERENIITGMARNNVRDLESVNRTVQNYYAGMRAPAQSQAAAPTQPQLPMPMPPSPLAFFKR